MFFKADKIQYKQKPKSEDIARIQARLKNMPQIELTIDELARTIARGSSFYLCQFKENGKLSIDNVSGSSYIGIDIDNKEHITTLEEAIELTKTEFQALPLLSYHTFSSSSDVPKFRIIYELDKFIDATDFRKLYNSLILTINKDHEVIDSQASNINRLWSGTNKKVTVYENSIPFSTSEVISRLPKVSEKKKAPKKDIDTSSYKYSNRYYIKDKKTIMNQLKNEIDIKDYLETHFNVQIKNNRCACPIHGGTNKRAFAVYNDTVHCFTHCGTMNIISLAREYYKIQDFDEVAFRLIEEYDIDINENLLGTK